MSLEMVDRPCRSSLVVCKNIEGRIDLLDVFLGPEFFLVESGVVLVEGYAMGHRLNLIYFNRWGFGVLGVYPR